MKTIPCLCCNRRRANYFFTKKYRTETYAIYRCGYCKSAFVWPRPGTRNIEALYAADNNDPVGSQRIRSKVPRYYPEARHDADMVLKQCGVLSTGKRLLDVGAGFGDFSKAALKKGFKITAREPNAMSRDVFSRLNGFEPDPVMFDAQYAAKLGPAFNVVTVSHVLEHILDPDRFVENIRNVLDKGGITTILVPHFGSVLSILQGKRDMFISPPEHLNFFSKKGLCHLFYRHGFSLKRLETTSKINRRRLEQTIRIPVVSTLSWVWLYMGLAFLNPLNMGMVINAYFKKET